MGEYENKTDEKPTFVESNPEILETHQSFILRATTPEDKEKMFSSIDSNRKELGEWLIWVENTRSSDDTLAFIEKCIEDRKNKHDAVYGIFIGEDYAGSIDLRARKGNIGEIGYWLDKRYQGRGIVTEAAKILVDLGFEKLGCEKILIRADERNDASRAVAERLGFVFDGIHIDKKRSITAAHYILEKR